MEGQPQESETSLLQGAGALSDVQTDTNPVETLPAPRSLRLFPVLVTAGLLVAGVALAVLGTSRSALRSKTSRNQQGRDDVVLIGNVVDPCAGIDMRQLKQGDPCKLGNGAIGGVDNLEKDTWEVMYDNLNVRAKPTLKSDAIGTKSVGTVVRGVKLGNWVKLDGERGYVKIEVPGDVVYVKQLDAGDTQAEPSPEFPAETPKPETTTVAKEPLITTEGAASTTTKSKSGIVDEADDKDDGKAEASNLPCSGGGEDCSKSQCCAEPGMQCYEKVEGWAMCKPTCTADAPDPSDIDSTAWTCKKFGPRTPGVAKEVFVPAAKWVNKTCAGGGENCEKARCCKEEGMKCYQKTEGWAACKPHCSPDAPDPTDNDATPWTCKAFSERTPGVAKEVYVKPAPWVEDKCAALGEDCSSAKCCKDEGHQCFQKHDTYAACIPSCTPGPNLQDENAAIWSCNPLGLRTPGDIPPESGVPAPWVLEECAAKNEDCRKAMCCRDSGFQCFEKNDGWATCRESCEEGIQENDVNQEPWSCTKVGPMWTTTSTTTTTTRTYGSPSLFCYSVSRNWGYEPEILKYQLSKRSGIFACDETAVLCSEPLTLETEEGDVVKAVHFDSAPVGESKDHTAGNALLFMHVWDAINADGKFALTDWTVKMDPDAVLLPDRLRNHVKDRTGENVFVRNCNAFPSSGDFPMMYGSMEVLSRKALQTYFDNKAKCDGSLPWPAWGEDYYLGKCLMFLGVATDDDFSIVSDGVCTGVNCNDGQAAAFHPFKSVDDWKNCFNQAIGR